MATYDHFAIRKAYPDVTLVDDSKGAFKEDGTKVESIGNRLVTFDSHIKHSGTSCTDQKYRLVLNMNYFPFN